MRDKSSKSIIDIAKDLGVSKGTVSSVLNGKSVERRISEDTKKVILDYIEKSGFRPNAIARTLRTGRSQIIGMLVEDISNPFFASIAHLVEQKVALLGYRILLSSTENDSGNAAAALATFWEQQVDGYIIVPPAELPEEIMDKIIGYKPVVLFDRTIKGLDASSVLIDNYTSIVLATNHLIEQGYKQIALITIESTQLQMFDRLQGYKDTLLANQLTGYICEVDRQLSEEAIKEQIEKFIKKNEQIDSIIFSTNYIALLGLRVLQSLCMQIPGDIGVVGFDESPYYELMSPAITSIVQPLNEMADRMVALLMQQIDRGDIIHHKPMLVQLNAVLIERQSSIKL